MCSDEVEVVVVEVVVAEVVVAEAAQLQRSEDWAGHIRCADSVVPRTSNRLAGSY